MSEAVFEFDGDRFIPQPAARAGWYEDGLHGGPVAALFARQIERVDAPVPMMVTRLTLDLMRPVLTRPLTVRTRVVRAGKRIQVIDAEMEADGIVVARASALRIRLHEVTVPDHPRREAIASPETLPVYEMREAGGDWYHTRAAEARFVAGDFYQPGPATVWMRLTLPLLAGEEPTPLQRVAAVSDFGNGLSRVLPWGWLFINADLTINLSRYPIDEWVCLRSRTDIDGHGIGLAQSELYDRRGAIGHALQGLIVEKVAEGWTPAVHRPPV